jgi:hypothetical protein
MSGRHSQLLRGLEAAGTKPNFQGRFGRMFKDLPAANFGDTADEEHENLAKLAEGMVSPFDPPKDGPDAEESGIPALYTYFGQFIDHDLTFDPDGSFQKQKDPDATTDFRTPAFDLDNVYGRGPGDEPYMYQDDGKALVLGDPIMLGDPNARDLQRNAAGRALIGDPRNDENALVSKLQGLFLRFHNRVVAENAQRPFAEVQSIVRRHYQYVVIHDFLTRVVNPDVLASLKTDGAYDKAKLRFFTDLANPFMPVEFSVAAYRFGHSMIRPAYRLNDATLLPIFPLPSQDAPGYPEGLTGFRRLIRDWALDWGRFIDIDVRDYGVLDPDPKDDKARVQNFNRLQLAYRIDTALVHPLGALPASVAGDKPLSLAHRNLLRGREFGLPSGQTVATAMGVGVLDDADILIGQGVDSPVSGQQTPITGVSKVFSGNCPLWTYVLAEAMHSRLNGPTPTTGQTPVNTLQLGPVGGRIVAEVFIGLMFADTRSLLSEAPDWRPDGRADYRLKDFVAFALGR